MQNVAGWCLPISGLQATAELARNRATAAPALDPDGHKYNRGLVHVLAGKMPGAIALSAKAAALSGAGYVRISTSRPIDGLPQAIVQTDTAEINDGRIGCLLVGPGMGDIPQVLTLALTSKAPKVIDADAITHLGEPERLKGQDAILTPHEGEFKRLFGELPGSKAERAIEAARKMRRGHRLQGAANAGRFTGRAIGFRAAGAGMAGKRGDRGCSGRDDRRACGRGACRRSMQPVARRLASRPRGRNRGTGNDRRRPRASQSRGASPTSMDEQIVRIAARGDGVTAVGRHVPFGVPGDALLDDGA